MKAPKRVIENEMVVSKELRDEQLKIMRSVLWNDSISNETANRIIDDFNVRWISAGGLKSNSIIRRESK